MKLIILFLFISINIVFAQDYLVQVSTSLSEDNVKDLEKRLKEFGYTPLIKQVNDTYTILVGPFNNNKKADVAAKDISHKLQTPQAYILKKLTYIYPKMKQTKRRHKPKPEKIPLKNTPEKLGFYAGLSLGSNRVRIHESNENNGIVIESPPDEDGVNYAVELGYFIFDNAFINVTYQKSIFDNTNFNDVLIGLNYRFAKIKDMYLYVGVTGGYSRMVWTENPIDATQIQDQESFSFLIGGNIGAQTYIFEKLSFIAQYQYHFMQQQTLIKVQSEEKTFVHYGMHTLNIGLRYDF